MTGATQMGGRSGGLTIVASALGLGAVRQFVGIRGVDVWSSFSVAVAELRLPTLLTAGMLVATAGLATCVLQERRPHSGVAAR